VAAASTAITVAPLTAAQVMLLLDRKLGAISVVTQGLGPITPLLAAGAEAIAPDFLVASAAPLV
jgi:hypothetical protein